MLVAPAAKPRAVWSAAVLNSTSALAFSTIFLPVVSFENIAEPAEVFSAEIAVSIESLAAMVAVFSSPLT